MSATYRRTRYSVASLSLALALILSALLVAVPPPAQAVSPNIVISQVYGGGGNSGATYKNDFVELYNLGATPVDVTGWSVQYAATALGLPGKRTALSGTIQPGHYYLVQEAAGAGGTVPLPQPDASASIAMSATARKSGAGQQQPLICFWHLVPNSGCC